MMGCFFGCFRFKPNDQAIDDVICPKISYSRSKGGFNQARQESNTSKKNQLSSMFQCEDGESLRDNGTELSSIDREMKKEANFLKAGAIMETPDEIRKTSQNKTYKKINWNEKTDPTLLSSVLNSEKSKRYTPEQTKSRSKRSNSLFSLMSDSSNVVQVEETPLSSTSQFVYPVLKHGDDISKCKSKTCLSCQPGHLQPEEFLTPNRKNSVVMAPNSNVKGEEKSTLTDSLPSLSQWLKPPLPEEERRKIREAFLKESSPSGKSTNADRPIIGIVAAHWNDKETTRISPKKWFDGNGIPNSTNKYKEDQKVSWHATPFEERLEKALSDDSQLLGRKLGVTNIQFDEECDTAAS